MHPLWGIVGKWLAPVGADLPDLYMVGGAVRDCLLGRAVADIDLMCRDPGGLARIVARARNAAVVPFLKKADIPCYRVVDRDDSEDYLDLAAMYRGDVEMDLARRDFTINAMAIRVLPGGAAGESIDPFNGRKDLADRIVRCTGPEAFIADPLRIIRAVRFAAQFDFTIDPKTMGQIKTAAGTLPGVAGERIFSELKKILAGPNSHKYIRLMDDLDVLETIIPEIVPMKGCVQNEYHHLDVWAHSLAVLKNCESILSDSKVHFGAAASRVDELLHAGGRLYGLKLAALLHDCGKPGARRVNDVSGKVTFYGHDEAGEKMADNIADRLKMSKNDRAFLLEMVSNHMHALFLSRPEVKQKTVLKWFRRLRDDMVPLLVLSMADARAALGPAAKKEKKARHDAWAAKTVIDYFNHLKPKLSEKPLVNGNDVMAMGVAPGVEVGRILEKIREAQDSGRIKNRGQALAYAKQLIDAT